MLGKEKVLKGTQRNIIRNNLFKGAIKYKILSINFSACGRKINLTQIKKHFLKVK